MASVLIVHAPRLRVRVSADSQDLQVGDTLAEIDRRRTRYQEMAADDLITFDELRARLVELDDRRIPLSRS